MRWTGYDYAQPGAYFVTMCVQGRACLFGDIVGGEMRLNEAGSLVEAVWEELPDHYPGMQPDAFVVMPNHVHGIVVLLDGAGTGIVQVGSVGAGFKPAPTKPEAKRHGLAEIVRAFKTFSARRINELRGTAGQPVWQRNYYDRVIRDEDELDRIRTYIADNPANWAEDEDNLNALGAT